MSMVRVYFYEYAYGVGFGIAYPRMRGLYQSLICGMSDESQDPALFISIVESGSGSPEFLIKLT